MIMKREIYEMDLPHRAISIYMYLRDRADKQGRCFPSFQTIAREDVYKRQIPISKGLSVERMLWRSAP